MLHRRLTGIIAFISAAAVAGCFTQGQSGDPGAGFLGGSGRYYSGTAGWSGSGTAGASSASDAGTAGATGEGGSICGVGFIMATPDGGMRAEGGTRADGATTDASSRDGATANEAGAASDASADGVAAPEAGAPEAGATEAGAAAPATVCTVGAISLSWSLERAGTTIAETCAQGGVATIRLVANAMNVDFSCGNGAGRTPALAAGTYAVSLHALDATGLSISDTPTMNVTVVAGQITALGDAVFDVD
jgi:hypothetical protein